MNESENVIIDPNSFYNPDYINPNMVYTGMGNGQGLNVLSQLSKLLNGNRGLTGADYLTGAGSILGGLAGLGAYFNGRKQLGLARDQLNMQRNVYLDNRNNQAKLINGDLQDTYNTRFIQNTGSKEGADALYQQRKLSMLNSI